MSAKFNLILKKLSTATLLFVSVAFFVFASACGGGTIEIITDLSREIDILYPEVRAYLVAENETAQAKSLVNVKSFEGGYYGQTFCLSWNSDGGYEYTVYLSEYSDLRNAEIFHVRDTIADIGGTLIPGKKYYVKVSGKNKSSRVRSFKVKDLPVRMINAQGADNIRDLGGRKTSGGGTVSYGKLFRGGKINDGNLPSLTESGLFVMNERLGIKSEIDLRQTGRDDGGQTKSVLGEEVNYLKAGFTGYSYIIPEFENYGVYKRSYAQGSTEAIKSIFSFLADEKNYPVYFHCNAGADRTGTLALLIEAAIGVSEEDIIRDFELTSFSEYGARYRGKIENGKFVNGVMQDDQDNFVAFGLFIDDLKNYYGNGSDSLNEAAVNYLVSACKVTEAEIDALRSILLG